MKKNIIVTGASRGIGKELVRMLSKEHHVLAVSRNREALVSLQKENPLNISIEAQDISKTDDIKYTTSYIKEHLSKVDILINNAGSLVNKPIESLTSEDIQLMYQTNVFGPIHLCQAVVPLMTPGSHIVNIGSMGGFQGSAKFPGLSGYSSSKAAIASFSECLAEELKDKGIQVNCLALGAAQTEMLAEAFPGYQAPVSAQEMAQFIGDFSLNGNMYFNGKVLPISSSTP